MARKELINPAWTDKTGGGMRTEDPKPAAPAPNRPGYIPTTGPGHATPNMPDIYKRLREAHQARQPQEHQIQQQVSGGGSWQNPLVPQQEHQIQQQVSGGGGWQNPLAPQTHLPGAPDRPRPMPGFDRDPAPGGGWNQRELPAGPDTGASHPHKRQLEETRDRMVKEFQQTPPSYMQGISPEILKKLWEDILRQMGAGQGRRG